MAKTTDALKEFAALRKALSKEKEELESRLAEIEEALGTASSYSAPHPRRPASGGGSSVGSGRRGNPGSLKSMVIEVLKGKSLNRHEILDAVLKAGYIFKAKDPLNSLGTTLYTSKEIKTESRGVFSLA